jgi:hypothetical protein
VGLLMGHDKPTKNDYDGERESFHVFLPVDTTTMRRLVRDEQLKINNALRWRCGLRFIGFSYKYLGCQPTEFGAGP